ncbi:ROK family protein [Salibacterium sp. K-3]
MKQYIVFDFGGTTTKHGVVKEDGIFLEKSSYKTNIEEFLIFKSDLFSVINVYLRKYAIDGIAISMPGFIDTETGYSEFAGAIKELNGKNLKTMMEEHFPIKVEIENDGNCAALAEKFNGNAVDCKSFICFTVGTGIGGGIFLNGSIWHGASFRGGEFGYMVTEGNNKNLHENASMKSLIKEYKEILEISEETPIDGEEIFEKAKTDAKVHDLLDHWLRRMAHGIFNLTAVLNPEKILIGGGVSEQKGLEQEIMRRIEELEWWQYVSTTIETCKHKNDAGMLGALYHFKEKGREM